MTGLPNEFIQRMKHQLGLEADAFLASFQEPRTQGLRLNPIKLSSGDDKARQLISEWGLEPVPWCPGGFYYGEEIRPGKHPYHSAGVYYIQEPSAMSAVSLLDPQPGEVILDLAAAPGGKSTQIAGRLQGQGLLISNEIHLGRAKILAENIERLGIRNSVVVSSSPDGLAKRFPSYFDRIMLDAPCSGEGMFRKDPEAAKEWNTDSPAFCASRQMDILREAVTMLKPGGTLGYSTCTFNREENEDTMEQITKELPELAVEAIERIWPHRQKGEGHFVAILRKKESDDDSYPSQHDQSPKKIKPSRSHSQANARLYEAWGLFQDFVSEKIPGFQQGPGEPLLFGDHLYWLPHAAGCSFQAKDLDSLKVLRPGLHLAEVKKNRIEPSHALALAIQAADAVDVFTLPAEAPETAAYLRGETLNSIMGSSNRGTGSFLSGWTLVAVDGFPLGWAKASGGQLKNHYPKGLRRTT